MEVIYSFRYPSFFVHKFLVFRGYTFKIGNKLNR